MNKQTKWIGAAALLAASSLVLAACSADDEANKPSGDKGGDSAPAAVEAKPDNNPVDRADMKQGGTVVSAIGEITTQLNALHNDGSANTMTLWTWYNPQVMLMTPEGEVYENPAYLSDRTVEEVDGNTVVTYTFTDEATFNDGTPMDWKTIEATWRVQSGEGDYQPNSTDGYRQIASVEKGETDKQAVVTFKGTFAWVDALFQQVIHPDAAKDAKTFNESYINEPHPEWGAGPYTIGTWDADKGTVTFVPNEKWWGDEPMLDERTFRVMEATATINAFKAGEIDMVATASADRLAQVADMDGVKTYRAPDVANALLQFNANTPALSDINVRKAAMLAIDREQIKEVNFQGLDWEEPPAGSFNLYPFQEGYEDSFAAAGYEFNSDESATLLDEAGWTMGDDGIREKDGEKLSFGYTTFGDDPTSEAIARVIQQQLKAVGIELNIENHPSSEFATVVNEGDWDTVIMRFTSSDPFGVMWMCQIYCMDQGLNLSDTSDETFDSRIHEQVEALPTAEEQIPAAMKLEAELMSESWGIMPVYNGPIIATAKEGLANMSPEPYSGLDMFGVQPVENFGWAK
ncbi:peptide ABC transporter substrate-binding protein [Microbacterium sorbitolivorans]|uniref:ABC transporter family substrate-binding protein n=1 Tax=Microbacterium sorbitolivorans TaxID=1867410 RepID=A0A367Y769_9MICO|nr:ABC transporter family substrate-binding protein [Microbacterium sorbitolivorans]RCK61714.1 ABC transporter family substrate-binding protein [Microbacterium sorbitolivorans]GGF29786.1 peptide ABC transporter substrate-binding protein [Microbacterium sorbitolivorans]